MSIRTHRLATSGILLLLVAPVASVNATNIVLNVLDGPAEGFNDPTPVAPVTGNPGTTLGEQRLNVFQAATQFWEQRLQSDVDIVVDAQFNPQTCLPTTAVLGAAGPLSAARDFPNAPQSNQIYAIAIANSLAGEDLNPGSDIATTFNSTLDLGSADCLGGMSWDYRLGEATGSSLELFSTVLHELAHGLGFVSFHDLSTGALLAGLNDSYTINLADQSTGLAWPDMTDEQRLASSTNTGNLVWTGEHVAAESGILIDGLQPDGVQMFAPNPLQPGSSVSHWDRELSPDELMEPVSTENPGSVLTTSLMYDIGWRSPALIACNGLNITVDIAAGERPTAGDDVILGTSAADFIRAGTGNDTICAQGGSDVIVAGDGNDYVEGGDGDDEIRGGTGNDVIFGGTGADLLDGGNGDDEIFGEAGNDIINGRVGEDVLDGGDGVDAISGGPDADTIFTGSGATVGSGLFVGGGGDDDTIFGGPDADDLRGEGGEDTIRGRAGNDFIVGGIGRDLLRGGPGNDDILGLADNDNIFGGEGDDSLAGGSGDDNLNGGNGLDFCAGQSDQTISAVNCE